MVGQYAYAVADICDAVFYILPCRFAGNASDDDAFVALQKGRYVLRIVAYDEYYNTTVKEIEFWVKCSLAPIAMAAVVIGGMLGADVENMATYSLLCNIATALVAPLVLSLAGNGECTLWQILAKVAPLLISPFVAAQLCRLAMPRVAGWFASHGRLSFYFWLVSLAIVIGRTTCFIIDYGTVESGKELLLAAVAGVICIAQFALGRAIGRRYGDVAAGGQSLGQKNTVLAIWMSQSFLDPLSCVAPTAYIVWQNIVNSYQLHKKRDL